MAAACEHAELTAKQEIGEAIPPRLFRPCVLVATKHRRAFRAGGACRREVAARGAGPVRVRAQAISRLASRDRDAARPRRYRCDRADARRCDGPTRVGASPLTLVGAKALSRVGATTLTLVGATELTLVVRSHDARRAISSSSEPGLRAVETLSTLPREIDWRTPRDCAPGP